MNQVALIIGYGVLCIGGIAVVAGLLWCLAKLYIWAADQFITVFRGTKLMFEYAGSRKQFKEWKAEKKREAANNGQ